MHGNQPNSITVIGSINMDLVGTTNQLPKAGETLSGTSFKMNPGGKGANQAVGVSRLGANVNLVGKIGDDIFGKELILNLRQNNVNVELIQTSSGTESGIALILLDINKENYILVIPGANGTCDKVQIEAAAKALLYSKCLLMQFEIPTSISFAAAKVAHNLGVTTILDPSPCINFNYSDLESIDIITPNQHEAEFYTGIRVVDKESACKAAELLRSKRVKTVIITLGSEGAYYSSKNRSGLINGNTINVVDTVGAGDAFNAGLAVAISKKSTLEEAIKYAVACGSLAVTKSGAQNAMPYINDVSHFIENSS